MAPSHAKPPEPESIRIPSGVRAVLLVGGTFDPPHRAHTELASGARDAIGAGDAWVVFVPAARSPHKDGLPGATPEQRLRMLELATIDIPRATIWTDEIEREPRGEASYWVDTIDRARRVLGPGVELRFLIGADQAAAFHRWHRPRDILSMAAPVVVLREPTRDRADFFCVMRGAGEWSDSEIARWAGSLVELPLASISATALRDALAADGADAPEAVRWLDPRVRAYIREHGLYVGRR